MVRCFDDMIERKAAWRALQIWQILIGYAHNKKIMTYGELADILGYKSSNVFSELLGHIMFYCAQNKLPPLTVIVVNAETGFPGEGFTEHGDYPTLEKARMAVYRYNWYGVIPPTVDELHNANQLGKSN